MITRELDLQINPPGPKEYVPHLNSLFELPNHVEREAFEILRDTETTGGNPAAIAAAALYTATQDSDSLTLQTAGKAAGVSKETVWRHSTEFK
jgi:transcription initiation factor TFIIB